MRTVKVQCDHAGGPECYDCDHNRPHEVILCAGEKIEDKKVCAGYCSVAMNDGSGDRVQCFQV